MSVEQQSINALRILSMEAISKAKSGHPGVCMDAAPIAYTLYSEVMNYDPSCPEWENRDRFIMSAGHGSALVYSLLHLFGFGVTAQDLASFRHFGSITPGHPERSVTPGVDMSTGALGQGVASAVGFALAESHLAAVFNRQGFPIVDHYTYCICGEGCLEEGVGYEACSFAGTQKLNKLILFYDCNQISIEGDTTATFSEDIALRFRAQGWNVLDVADANDIAALRLAIQAAKAQSEAPTVIVCHSIIGYGTPTAATADAHGNPLNAEQLQQTKDFFGWTEQPFSVPQEVKEYCASCAQRGANAKAEWDKTFARYQQVYPQLAAQYHDYFQNTLPDFSDLYTELASEKAEATRSSNGVVLNAIAKRVPNLLSGSADLAPSTKTKLNGEEWFSAQNRLGRNIHFGIREHAMAAICNGIAAHGGLRVLCSTFFVFCDYMKGAMRLSALMNLPVLYALTHDSIGVGEDGPTHQPIEQLAMLRTMPNTQVFRPCNRQESLTSFVLALQNQGPSVLVLSRQNLVQHPTPVCDRGGYMLELTPSPDVLLVSCGSEVNVCIQAQKLLQEEGLKANVVNLYCTEIFDEQSKEYRESVLPVGIPRVCVEASSDNVWYKYAQGGAVIGIRTFGASGAMEDLYAHFGITPSAVASAAKELLK